MSSSTPTPPDTNGANSHKRPHSPDADSNGREGAADNSNVPKPKRLACMICRKRKLKCDGVRPSCSTCARLGHSCAYDEVRRKSGPKRGYVKALEERLSEHSRLCALLFFDICVLRSTSCYFYRVVVHRLD